jgi:PiT family inorganic phosphate transporter
MSGVIMETSLLVVISLIVVALIFDFTNGFHDAANSIATVVATKTLTPIQAVAMAAFFNFIIMFFITFKVAATIGKGIVIPQAVTLFVIFGCLMGAITWNLITWWLGLPTSSSHALIGGLIGAAIASGGWNVIMEEGLFRILSFIVAAPIIGFVLGASFNTIVRNMFPKETNNQNKWFKRLQLLSSACYSMGHGANDAQKTAGIIFLILVAGGYLQATDNVPYWAVLICFIVMGLGTLAGGWKIVHTLGFKLTELSPRQGFSAETGGSMMLFGASVMGIPVSTTHTITGAILGVGASQPEPKVHWKKAGEILIAWILTIPCSALLAYAFWELASYGNR